MGNEHTSGFCKVPDAYLRDLRRKTDRRYRSLVMSHRRRLSSSGVIDKEQVAGESTELTPESVTDYLSSNPDFLDQLVKLHIAQDRVKAWIKEPTADSLEELATVQDLPSRSHPQGTNSATDMTNGQEESDSKPEAREDPSKQDHVGRRKSSTQFEMTTLPQKKAEDDSARHRSESILRRADMGSKFNKKLMERRNQQIGLMIVNRDSLMYPKKHNTEELKDLIERHITFDELNLDSHLFSYEKLPANDLNHIFIKMVHNLMGENAFPMVELTYFLSALRGNYKDVAYHNYHHALSHAQSMYWILKNNPDVFTELEMKALMIASISHDVGHPGLDDYFMKKVSTGFQLLYDQPLLENHHAQVCFQILQDIKCNVFCDFNADDYKFVLDDIKNAIISTNIDRYKIQAEKLRTLMEGGSDLHIPTTRLALKSLMMMVCDLCANWKEWEAHKSIIKTIFKEFYAQGDLETHLNIPSKPHRSRASAGTMHKAQISFMEAVVIPVFRLLSDVFPSIRDIKKAAKENLENWKTRSESSKEF